MPIETANYINTLDPNLPATTDDVGQSDDHVRMIKRAIKATWPNITEPVTATATQINSPFPIGGIIMFAGSTVPTGWALCNGQTATLADGSGTITTPDLRDRFIIGAGTIVTGTVGGSVALTASTSSAGGHSHSASTDAQGAHSHGGGTAGHALSVEELAPHVHGYVAAIQGAGGSSGLYTPSPANVANQGRATDPMGSGAPHSHGIALDGTHAHNVSVSAVGDHTHGHGHRRSAAVLRPRGHPQALMIIPVRNIASRGIVTDVDAYDLALDSLTMSVNVFMELLKLLRHPRVNVEERSQPTRSDLQAVSALADDVRSTYRPGFELRGQNWRKRGSPFTETKKQPLRNVSDVMPDVWWVNLFDGLLSRFKVEYLQLVHGEVRKGSSLTVGGPILTGGAFYAGQGIVLFKLS